jgi:6,7-dimethyl-8-ribityllumazine synthase
VGDDEVDTIWVPGAWEIPLVASAVAQAGRHQAIVALGAVVRGDTYHFEVIANQSAAGLARTALDTGVVVTNGILTVDTTDQAVERAGGKAGNKGADAALAALETLDVLGQLGPR